MFVTKLCLTFGAILRAFIIIEYVKFVKGFRVILQQRRLTMGVVINHALLSNKLPAHVLELKGRKILHH